MGTATTLEQARKAAEQVSRQRELEQQAAQLQELERAAATEAARKSALDDANIRLERLTGKLAYLKSETVAYNERLQAAISELETLARELPDLQDRLKEAAREASAVNQRYRFAAGRGQAKANDIPPEMSSADFSNVWEQVGGFDEALRLFVGVDGIKQRELLKKFTRGRVFSYLDPHNVRDLVRL